jgi:hypothetical protein
VGFTGFVYAVLGFRVDGLRVLQRSSNSPVHLLVYSGIPLAIASGTALLALWGIRHLVSVGRRDVVMSLTLGAWLAAVTLGITGGGGFYPHYFIALIPVTSVLGGCALAKRRGRRRWARISLGLLTVLAALNLTFGTYLSKTSPPQQQVLAVVNYLHSEARPDDSLYVMYARANLAYYSGLHTPFRYEWSLMMRAIPDSEPRLRTWLSSPDRPTWIVQWQSPTAFGLDASGATQALLLRHYHKVASVCGRDVLVRDERVTPEAGSQLPITCASAPELPRWIPIQVPRSRSNYLDYFWS